MHNGDRALIGCRTARVNWIWHSPLASIAQVAFMSKVFFIVCDCCCHVKTWNPVEFPKFCRWFLTIVTSLWLFHWLFREVFEYWFNTIRASVGYSFLICFFQDLATCYCGCYRENSIILDFVVGCRWDFNVFSMALVVVILYLCKGMSRFFYKVVGFLKIISTQAFQSVLQWVEWEWLRMVK